MTQDRQSFTLTKNQWERLDELAITTDSKSTKGPQKGTHSWRAFLRRIANDEIQIEFGNNLEKTYTVQKLQEKLGIRGSTIRDLIPKYIKAKKVQGQYIFTEHEYRKVLAVFKMLEDMRDLG